MEVSYQPEVKDDLRGSYDYYHEIEPELGLGFIEEYRKRWPSLGVTRW
ncbi:MAG: hypothetical protein AAGH40_00030 [Verrucomicrobiota bacterium]